MRLKHTLFEGAELRLFEESDAEEVFALLDGSREHLREWLPFLDSSKSVDSSLDFIRFGRKQIAENNGMQLAIIYEGKIAGVVGFHSINWSNRSTSIGYWLGAPYTGKGLITEAVRACVDYAFDVWKLNRVVIQAAVENRKSQAVPKRLGFVQEGIARQSEWLYDHFVDHAVFSMLAEDWKEARK